MLSSEFSLAGPKVDSAVWKKNGLAFAGVSAGLGLRLSAVTKTMTVPAQATTSTRTLSC